MKKALPRLCAFAILGFVSQTQLNAQTPAPNAPIETVPAPKASAPAITVPAVVVNAGPAVDVTPPPVSPRPLQRLLNSHGMGCASNFNNLGCGNFCSEFKFVFGSCRTFFGQSCIPNSPHFGPGNGYGFDGPQKCCGN
jgi:hypothetical protein